jgi:phosphoribosyl-ATP pyrophosphohydrolase/phosphoribosyl-AMP cyclohydrolase
MSEGPMGLNGLEDLDFAKGKGLLPVIVQNADTGAVLMLGYMNRAALEATLASRKVVFFSRNKGRLWEKGESSGHTLKLVAVHTDCDRDALLVTARPQGPVCHLGTESCFAGVERGPPTGFTFLGQLEDIIRERTKTRPEGSYTAALVSSGIRRIAQKVGEEGLELSLAGAVGSDSEVIAEAADLVYHLMVLLEARKLTLERIGNELRSRHADRVIADLADATPKKSY